MRGFAAFVLAFVVVSFALPVEPALAQSSKSKRAAREAIIRDPIKLAEVCNALVFRKYGQPDPLYGPRNVKMPLELHAQMQNSCIMSKGRNY